jgi:hypothetical protein
MTGVTRLELEGLRHVLERVPTADSFRASAPNALVGFLARLRQWDQTERQPWLRRLDEVLTNVGNGDDHHLELVGVGARREPPAREHTDGVHGSGEDQGPRAGEEPALCPVCGERALTPAQTACSARCRQRRSRAARRGHTPVTPPQAAGDELAACVAPSPRAKPQP